MDKLILKAITDGDWDIQATEGSDRVVINGKEYAAKDQYPSFPGDPLPWLKCSVARIVRDRAYEQGVTFHPVLRRFLGEDES